MMSCKLKILPIYDRPENAELQNCLIKIFERTYFLFGLLLVF